MGWGIRAPSLPIPPQSTKVPVMEALQAVVLTQSQLNTMLEAAGVRAAELAVRKLHAELHQSPEDTTLQSLREYIANPGAVANPHDQWAHSGIIRLIQPTAQGEPKSVAWFMKFQRRTGLKDCHTRPSPVHGRRKEWTFHDIKLAWDSYYQRR